MEVEIWKDVIGYEGLYQVSNLGRVKKLPEPKRKDKRGHIRGRDGCIRKPCMISGGYHGINLSKNGTQKPFKIHRLVITHFKPNPTHLPQVNHIDCNKLNNRVDNLEWCTRKQNMEHAAKHGLLVAMKGTTNPAAKLNESQVRAIRSSWGKIPTEQLSEIYHVSQTTIIEIKSRKSWVHLQD
jgi:hypothetical protein